jgi:hypothetical protein
MTQTKGTSHETKIIHQAALDAFLIAPLFLPLHLSDFSSLFPGGGLKAITHLLDFALDCRPR